MKIAGIKISLSALFLLILLAPVFALAKNTPTIQSLLAWSWIPLYLLLLVIMGLALAFFLWGVAIFILNSGNEDKRSEGRQKMFWGIVALVIMISIGSIMWILQIGLGILPVPRLN